jgi:hypothetical protein
LYSKACCFATYKLKELLTSRYYWLALAGCRQFHNSLVVLDWTQRSAEAKPVENMKYSKGMGAPVSENLRPLPKMTLGEQGT